MRGKCVGMLGELRVLVCSSSNDPNASSLRVHETLMEHFLYFWKNVSKRLFAETNQSINDQKQQKLLPDTSQRELMEAPTAHLSLQLDAHLEVT